MKPKTSVLCGTLDTKGEELFFLKQQLEENGLHTLVIDVGLRKSAENSRADITQDEVAQAAGHDFSEVEKITSRAEAADVMIAGLKKIVLCLYAEGKMDGILSLGGSGGTFIASAAMRCLPLGVPKLIVGTMASGDTSSYLQGLDILMLNSIVDVQSLNFLSTHFLKRAALIMTALVMNETPLRQMEKRSVAVTCFGVTTPCVEHCKKLLENCGYEVLVFHARGLSGGGLMEKMAKEGFFCGILDVTTTEVVDEVAEGAYIVGPNRLCAAPDAGIPYVVVPGALEMINIGRADRLKPSQSERIQYFHTPEILKIRANKRDMEETARIFVERLGRSKGTTRLVIPTRGFSSIDAPGNVFFDLATDAVFTNSVSRMMPSNVPVIPLDLHVNDPVFAEYLVKALLALMPRVTKSNERRRT